MAKNFRTNGLAAGLIKQKLAMKLAVAREALDGGAVTRAPVEGTSGGRPAGDTTAHEVVLLVMTWKLSITEAGQP